MPFVQGESYIAKMRCDVQTNVVATEVVRFMQPVERASLIADAKGIGTELQKPPALIPSHGE